MSTTTPRGRSTVPVAAPAAADTRTSTIVVAASNSLDPTLAPLLYRCTGVNDEVEMNAALVAAAAVSGRVELLEGDYNTVLTLSVAVNVTFVGNGWGSVINFNAGGNAITLAGDNIKLRDFKLVIVAGAGGAGTRPNGIYGTARTNVEIKLLWIVGDQTEADDGSDLRQNGILFNDDMAYSKIESCTVQDFERNGINLMGTTGNEVLYVEVVGNISYNNLDDGIKFEYALHCMIDCNTCEGNGDSGIGGRLSMYNTIVGNTCPDNTYGISVFTSSHNTTITGNNCYSGINTSILVSTSHYCTVVGNTTFQSGGIGISINDATYCAVTGNSCSDHTGPGIALTDGLFCSVVGNTCWSNTQQGINLNSSTDNTVSGNTLTSNGTGMRIESGSHNNTITGNNCITSGSYGIYVTASNYNNLVGNACRNNSYGIFLLTVSNCTVSMNTLYRNSWHGIILDTSSNCSIIGNICNENDLNNTGTYDGICIEDDSDYNKVMNNICNDNDRWGISIGIAANSCVGNWVKDNTLRGNTSGPFQDSGTNTRLAVKVFQFTEPVGTATFLTSSPAGIEVDAADEGALALGEAPLEVQMIVRFRVKGVALAAPGAAKGMLLEININAGKPAGHEAFNAEAIAVASVISTEDNMAINDAIEWIIDRTDDADIADIAEGETLEMFAMFEDTGANGDIATDALLRTISMEYV